MVPDFEAAEKHRRIQLVRCLGIMGSWVERIQVLASGDPAIQRGSASGNCKLC